jgi:ADP-dependent NAD(P)H-hydrate dehydratase / NAD(P)H-hydrate epimerase
MEHAKSQYPYWLKQTNKPLFPDIAWAKPEQKAKAGKLAVIGGHAHSFAATAESYYTAGVAGAGQVRVLLPEALKKLIPQVLDDTVFVASNPSGGFSKAADPEIRAVSEWADGILLIGDCGRNSETAMLYESLLKNTAKPITITRDAIDLLKNSTEAMLERDHTLLVLSIAQLQKLFQAVYYPKIITFSMQLNMLVEALHKFTITYPVAIMVLHNEKLVVANAGKISTTPWQQAMAIWRGEVATKASVYWLWNPAKVFEAAPTSLINS